MEELGLLTVPRKTGFPGSPVKSQLHYDNETNAVYFWDGTAWRSAAGVTGTGTGTIACRLATAAALPAYTRTSDKLEANANGALAAIDGVAPAVNDYVLLKEGAAGKDNGPYKVTGLGSAGSKWTMERAAEMDTSAECIPGMVITVAEGTQNGGIEFALLTTGTITLNTTALTFGYAGAWASATYLNTWLSYEAATFNPLQYRKTRDGRVVIRGMVKKTTGASGTSLMTLPAGFRPATLRQVFAAVGEGAGGTGQRADAVTVYPTGEVRYEGASSVITFMAVDISFYID